MKQNSNLHLCFRLTVFAQICPGMQFSIILPISSWWLDPPSRQEDIRAANAKLHSRANLGKFACECSLAFAFPYISLPGAGGWTHPAATKIYGLRMLNCIPGQIWSKFARECSLAFAFPYISLPGGWTHPAARKIYGLRMLNCIRGQIWSNLPANAV